MTTIVLAGASISLGSALRERLSNVTVVIAETGQEAWEAIRSGSITAAVIDDQMPGLPGPALLELIGGLGSTQRPRLYYVLAEEDRRLAQRMVEAGADRVLFHPVEIEELARQLLPSHGGASSDRASDLAAGLSAIWERYRPSIEAQVQEIEDAAIGLMEMTLNPEARREAERAAHKLVGAAGTFGFPSASQLAREAEHILDMATEVGAPEVLRLSEIAVSLRDILSAELPVAASVNTRASDESRSASATRLAILDADEEFRERVRLEAEARGMEVAIAGSLSEGRTLVAGAGGVDLVLIDPDLPEGADAGLAFVAELATWQPPVGTVVLSGGEGLAGRVDAARRNARLYLQKPLSPKRTIDAVSRVLAGSDPEGAKILVVDDAPEVLEAISVFLVAKGFEVSTLSDPLGFWTKLQETQPDLLLLDVDMPHVSGVELCRVVRNDERWSDLPVIFLTASRDAETIAHVFAAGADDFVTKPVIETEFLVRITNRLERVRLIRELKETDQLTGLFNRQRSLQAIEQLVSLGKVRQRDVLVATIDVDGLRNINAAAGYPEGDRLLKWLGSLLQAHLGSEDVAGRWGGEEFVVAMYGATRVEAFRAFSDILTDLGSPSSDVAWAGGEGASFSAGVAAIPEDGEDLSAAMKAARRALSEAKRRGGGQIVLAGWDGFQASDSADVVVVEDDDALAELLVHAVENRGLRVARFSDGGSAAEALTSGKIETRAALLDVDLPGLDGLSVLKKMADAGVLSKVNVIMLTARSAEAEVLRAMELGAFDHVAKPFSIPVLLQRLARALGER